MSDKIDVPPSPVNHENLDIDEMMRLAGRLADRLEIMRVYSHDPEIFWDFARYVVDEAKRMNKILERRVK
jgi:hypothetical protein